jgi:enoyl-CoA hydratase/carnithine racemase
LPFLRPELGDESGRRFADVGPPRAIAAVKLSVYAGSDTHLQAGLEVESACFLDTMLSDDGVRAMQEYVDLPLQRRRDWLERRGESPGYTGT